MSLPLQEAVARYLEARRALRYVNVGQHATVLSRLSARVARRLSLSPQDSSLVNVVTVADLLREDLEGMVDEVAAVWSPGTLVNTVIVLKSFGRWLIKRDLVLLDPARGLAIPKLRRTIGWVPSPSQVERLFQEARPERVLERVGLDVLPWKRKPHNRESLVRRQTIAFAQALRDVILLELLYGSGLRLSEALELRLSDLDLSERTAFIRQGKGKKDRVVPLTTKAVSALQRYLAPDGREVLLDPRRTPSSRRPPRPPSPLLLLSTVGGRLGKDLFRQTRFQPLVVAAGLPRALTPHRLRHACALHLLDAGADIVYIARLLGHARLSTTQVYLSLTTAMVGKALSAHPREREEKRQEPRHERAR